jgi:hypothetical protein
MTYDLITAECVRFQDLMRALLSGLLDIKAYIYCVEHSTRCDARGFYVGPKSVRGRRYGSIVSVGDSLTASQTISGWPTTPILHHVPPKANLCPLARASAPGRSTVGTTNW